MLRMSRMKILHLNRSRREGKEIATSLVAAVVFLEALGAVNTAIGADGIIYKQESTPGGYCHLKFHAIDEKSLSTNNPVLKGPDSQDIIDFYGPCDEDPLGKHQVEKQKAEELHWLRKMSFPDNDRPVGCTNRVVKALDQDKTVSVGFAPTTKPCILSVSSSRVD